MIVAVTAFVPIPGHPRPEAEYHRLAAPLRLLVLEGPLLATTMDLGHCWLAKYLDEFYDGKPLSWSVSDNPDKNSLEYHIVQAQKSEFLLSALQVTESQADVYVWIDYGIYHLPGVTGQIIKDFLNRADSERAIALPGCWPADYEYDDEHPCWRFAGGVWVVPRQYVEPLDAAMKREYVRWLEKTGNISWEVNVLSRIERREHDLPFWHYHAGHDFTMFTNYRKSEHADRGNLFRTVQIGR